MLPRYPTPPRGCERGGGPSRTAIFAVDNYRMNDLFRRRNRAKLAVESPKTESIFVHGYKCLAEVSNDAVAKI